MPNFLPDLWLGVCVPFIYRERVHWNSQITSVFVVGTDFASFQDWLTTCFRNLREQTSRSFYDHAKIQHFLTTSFFEINGEKCFLILHQEYLNEKSCIYTKRASFQGMLRTTAPKHLQVIQSTLISQYCVGMLQCSTRENISGLYSCNVTYKQLSIRSTY